MFLDWEKGNDFTFTATAREKGKVTGKGAMGDYRDLRGIFLFFATACTDRIKELTPDQTYLSLIFSREVGCDVT